MVKIEVLGDDPRSKAAEKPLKITPPTPEEMPPDFLGMFAIMFGMLGVMMRV